MRRKNMRMYSIILGEMRKDSSVTEAMIADKYGYSDRTIRRYIRMLKDTGVVKFKKSRGVRTWIILDNSVKNK